MTVTSLQQTIRRSIWPLHRCNKRFGGRNDRYIAAANDSGVEMSHYIAAANDSGVNMSHYIVATAHRDSPNIAFYALRI